MLRPNGDSFGLVFTKPRIPLLSKPVSRASPDEIVGVGCKGSGGGMVSRSSSNPLTASVGSSDYREPNY